MNLEFFAKLETTEQIILVLSVLSAIGMCLWFLWKIVLKIVEFFGAEISNGKLSIKAKIAVGPQKVHADCPLVKDFMQILQAQQLMLNKIFHIRDKEILGEQMMYAEQKVELAINQCEKSFCKLMEKNGKKDYLYCTEYISYRAFMEFMREKTLEKFRHMCKSEIDNFVDKSDESFNEYVSCSVTILSDMLIQFSKNFFPYYLTINGYVDSVGPIRQEIKNLTAESIRNARAVALKGRGTIRKLTDEFEQEYERLIGVKPKRIEL